MKEKYYVELEDLIVPKHNTVSGLSLSHMDVKGVIGGPIFLQTCRRLHGNGGYIAVLSGIYIVVRTTAK